MSFKVVKWHYLKLPNSSLPQTIIFLWKSREWWWNYDDDDDDNKLRPQFFFSIFNSFIFHSLKNEIFLKFFSQPVNELSWRTSEKKNSYNFPLWLTQLIDFKKFLLS